MALPLQLAVLLRIVLDKSIMQAALMSGLALQPGFGFDLGPKIFSRNFFGVGRKKISRSHLGSEKKSKTENLTVGIFSMLTSLAPSSQRVCAD